MRTTLRYLDWFTDQLGLIYLVVLSAGAVVGLVVGVLAATGAI